MASTTHSFGIDPSSHLLVLIDPEVWTLPKAKGDCARAKRANGALAPLGLGGSGGL